MVAGILFVIPISWASAATVHTANNGLDSSTCGGFTAPCRSIGRGLDTARAGDTVLVQPGRYGDLDRDGVLGGVGDENPDGGAALHISKPVKVLSTHGAVSTVIDGGSAAQAAVEIASSNVTFGGIEKGFTIIGGRDFGVGLSVDHRPTLVFRNLGRADRPWRRSGRCRLRQRAGGDDAVRESRSLTFDRFV